MVLLLPGQGETEGLCVGKEGRTPRRPHQACLEESRARMMGPDGVRGEWLRYWEQGVTSEQAVLGPWVYIRALPLDESLVLYEPQFPHLFNGDKSHISWQMGVVRVVRSGVLVRQPPSRWWY